MSDAKSRRLGFTRADLHGLAGTLFDLARETIGPCPVADMQQFCGCC